MEKKEQLYEGKAKKVFATDDNNLVIVSYKDDATAFNGLKKGTIEGKGVINNKMSNFLMQILEKEGVKTHFVEELSERETLVRKVKILPLEVIIRNISAGSFAKHYGVAEGVVFDEPTIEFSYKNDDLGDPLLNEYHALALKLATKDEIALVKAMAFKVNEVLKEYFKSSTLRSSISKSNLVKRRTARLFWRTKFPPIPVVSGIPRRAKSWIRTVSVATLAV